ncbi:MAG: quinone oxidoreductase [Candidatus Promineifilaceae bacterium]|nr:quinone oxidoreductase [Candidatus Promineifilaceae bacterium]
MKAIRIHEFGSEEVLLYEEVETPEPGPGEALVKLSAIGVNYIDTYHRTGTYPIELPFIPGMEGSGTIAAVGKAGSSLQVGDRVAFAMQTGAYAEYVIVPLWKLVLLPDEIDMETAAATMIQGMTAHYLTQSTYPVGEDDVVLVHAAAGGTGLLLVQMAKRSGATVIGTTSTTEKAALAKENGADEIILYSEQDFETEVLRLTNQRGVDVVYDSVGQATFDKSINCLRPRGYIVLFGAASGPVGPFDPQILNRKGSLFLTRPSLGHYMGSAEELASRTDDLYSWIIEGSLTIRIDRSFPLSDAAAAHRYIEGRKTKGKLLLLPNS